MSPSNDAWSLPHRIVFRFTATYFSLYFLTVGQVLPSGPAHQFAEFAIVHWFGFTSYVYPANTGSGDTLSDYVHVGILLLISILVAVILSLVDRRRSNYVELQRWLRWGLRYSLAKILFEYGFVKVFPTQFIPPSAARLSESFGGFSPMGVLWSFMGASMPYTIFSGVAEVVSATLLVFPRTATLGALMSAAVLVNVVVLNFSYDVAVKLHSMHYLVAALVLAAPDLRRLFRLLVLGQESDALAPAGPAFASARMRIVGIAAKGTFLAMVGWTAFSSYTEYRKLPTWYKPGTSRLTSASFQWIREYPDNR